MGNEGVIVGDDKKDAHKILYTCFQDCCSDEAVLNLQTW